MIATDSAFNIFSSDMPFSSLFGFHFQFSGVR